MLYGSALLAEQTDWRFLGGARCLPWLGCVRLINKLPAAVYHSRVPTGTVDDFAQMLFEFVTEAGRMKEINASMMTTKRWRRVVCLACHLE